MGKRDLLLCALLLLSVMNSAFGIRITFKLRAEGLLDDDSAKGYTPGADGYATVYVNNRLLKAMERKGVQNANVDWEDVFSINAQKGDIMRIDIRDFNGDQMDTWHGSVRVQTDDLEHVGPIRYRIIDENQGGRQSGTLILDVHAIRWHESSPCA